MAEPTDKIVHVTTADDLVLEGHVTRPAEPKPLAVVWVHGFTSRHSASHVVAIGRHLAAAGYTVVAGNNRGHDVGAMVRRTSGEGVLHGGAWERFEESPHDVAAWIDAAAAEGHRQVVLVGHSLGGLKVAYYLGTRQDARVAALVAVSPPLRAHRIDPESVALAERMAAEGRDRDLLPWGTVPAGAGTISAQTCLSWVRTPIDAYGLDTADPPIGKVRCPVLAVYGTNEAWIGGAAELEVIRTNARSAANVTTQLVDGADHVYSGREAELARVIAGWADRL